MTLDPSLQREHETLTRRYLLQMGVALGALPWLARVGDGAEPAKDALATAIDKLEYLTPDATFGFVGRGDPLPYTHPEEKLREVGLLRETWQLEIISDPDSPAKIETPRLIETDNAVDWDELMQLAEKHAVKVLKVMTCNNGNKPLGMGLWEGVPLRELIWSTKPSGDLRRVFFYGYHNDDPKQRFQSSLPIGRVLEDPPGESPVLVCYKLNGEYLSGKRGGPVRMLIPEAYGYKSVKWLQKVVLTNAPYANDTYANGNNDVDSWMKTMARFVSHPDKLKAGESLAMTGVAQVGSGGLRKVQYWLHPADAKWPEDDPNFLKAEWIDAELLAPPTAWGGGLPEGKLPTGVTHIDPATGRPVQWPLRYTIAHWAAVVRDVKPGKYALRCRTIDANGVAQPMPRPFPKSGRCSIDKVEIIVS
ncbi:MAG: molybdopterin-dependent oxidoreductase [Planctomycetaceae bacterium]|nr:molybdopterin-dependent oxidoreductase [Planctomycetaceae bacterium]